MDSECLIEAAEDMIDSIDTDIKDDSCKKKEIFKEIRDETMRTRFKQKRN